MVRDRAIATALVVVAGLVGAPVRPARAVDVFVNGVRVGRVTDVVLRGCTVRFDADGNVHIDAPGYEVTLATGSGPQPGAPPAVSPAPLAPAPPTAAAAAETTPRYFLVTRGTRPAEVRYRIDVFVNGTRVRTLDSTEVGVVEPLDAWLHPGTNTVRIRAYKQLEPGAPVPTGSGTFDVVIGRGHGQGATLVIDHTFVHYRRTATEVRAFDDTFTVTLP